MSNISGTSEVKKEHILVKVQKAPFALEFDEELGHSAIGNLADKTYSSGICSPHNVLAIDNQTIRGEISLLGGFVSGFYNNLNSNINKIMADLGEGSYGIEEIKVISGSPVKSERFSEEKFIKFDKPVDYQNEFQIYKSTSNDSTSRLVKYLEHGNQPEQFSLQTRSLNLPKDMPVLVYEFLDNDEKSLNGNDYQRIIHTEDCNVEGNLIEGVMRGLKTIISEYRPSGKSINQMHIKIDLKSLDNVWGDRTIYVMSDFDKDKYRLMI
ncbi:MAG: hypothetical protein GOV01_02415 [Candidatus Altiarchaeota archaeon]|nr:hypothetical protein [Candidatus Altiarchaeota archaeon]